MHWVATMSKPTEFEPEFLVLGMNLRRKGKNYPFGADIDIDKDFGLYLGEFEGFHHIGIKRWDACPQLVEQWEPEHFTALESFPTLEALKSVWEVD
jgi:hypothetical protein